MVAPSTLMGMVLLPLVLSTGGPPVKDDPSLAGVRSIFGFVRTYIAATAEMLPESLYGYRPTPDVRSVGQIFGHVANTAYLSCAAASGMPEPDHPDFEEMLAKEDLVSALQGAFAYCDEVYRMDGSLAHDPVTFRGQPHTRLSILAFNVAHEFEHYGNLVTYMRLNGIVPPSSGSGS